MIFNSELLREAHAIVDGIPEARFSLQLVAQNVSNKAELNNPFDCGTIACAAGWIAMHPDMQALGLGIEGKVLVLNGKRDPHSFYSVVMSKFFKIPESDARWLFGPRDSDGDLIRFGRQYADWSDKRVFLERVKWYLKTHAPKTVKNAAKVKV